MPQVDWIESPESWNTVILGPVALPGICVVRSRKGRDVDFKKAPEQDGGSDTDKGSNPGTVTITVTLTARQWAQWQAILPQIDPNRPGASTSPLEIRHPEPNSRGINSVRVLDITGDPPTARGGKQYTIECREWFPAPKPTKAGAKKQATQTLLNNQPERMTSLLFTGQDAGQAFQGSGPDALDDIMNNTFGT
jgi:hypothetical protein